MTTNMTTTNMTTTTNPRYNTTLAYSRGPINSVVDPMLRDYAGFSDDELLTELDMVDIKVEADLSTASFREFVKQAWKVIEPGRELVWNWHIDYVCEYLEAFHKRKRLSDKRILNRMILNIPVRSMKSLLVSVFYIPWVWTEDPSHQFLTLSHNDKLAQRDAVKSRVIINSEWYQRRWGKRFRIRADQNEKSRYETNKNGHRIAMGMKSRGTGENADTIIIDDPHDASQAQSEADRSAVLEAYDNKFSTRLNDPIKGGVCLIMQRLHELDLTGHLLKFQRAYDPDRDNIDMDDIDEPWEHLCLEMTYGGKPRYLSSLGLDEPRKEEGELLWPARFPRTVVERITKRLGSYGSSGQLQQKPTPASGGILKKAWWRMWPSDRPFPTCVYLIQSYDTAFTKEDHQINASSSSSVSSYSARSTWGVFYNELRGRYCILLVEAWRDKCEYPTLRKEAKTAYQEQDPDMVLIEDKASGSSLIPDLRRAGVPVVTATPGRSKRARGEDKIFRTYSVQSILESGLVYYPNRIWAEEFVEDVGMFPNGASNDWTDTLTQAWERIRKMFLINHPDDVTDEEDMEEHEEKDASERSAVYG